MKQRTPEEVDRILKTIAAAKSLRAAEKPLGLKKSAVWHLAQKHAARLQEIRQQMATAVQVPTPAPIKSPTTVARVNSTPGNLANAPLTTNEQHQLVKCETVIRRGLSTFYEVGCALQTIRDQRLYRSEYKTFADYCEGRWGTSKTQANRDIAAVKVVQMLNDPAAQTLTEWQLRPLTAVAPEKLPTVWNQAKVANKPITRELLLLVVGQPPAKAKAGSRSAKRGQKTTLHTTILQAVDEAEAALKVGKTLVVAAALRRIRNAVKKAAA